MEKPFHLLTPQEKTLLRIAQNRAIAEKVKAVPPAKSTSSRAASGKSSGLPATSPNDFTRATPEEHKGSVIRKVIA